MDAEPVGRPQPLPPPPPPPQHLKDDLRQQQEAHVKPQLELQLGPQELPVSDCMGTNIECIDRTNIDCMNTNIECMGTNVDCMGTNTACMGTYFDCELTALFFYIGDLWQVYIHLSTLYGCQHCTTVDINCAQWTGACVQMGKVSSSISTLPAAAHSLVTLCLSGLVWCRFYRVGHPGVFGTPWLHCGCQHRTSVDIVWMPALTAFDGRGALGGQVDMVSPETGFCRHSSSNVSSPLDKPAGFSGVRDVHVSVSLMEDFMR